MLLPYTRLDEPDTINGLAIVRAYNGDTFIGAAVESSANGFGGTIKVMVGFDQDGKIVNYSVLEQSETPGLGTKMVDWFKTPKGNQDIRQLNPSEVDFTVSKDGGDIDAITAATISSRAFLKSINEAYTAYAEQHTADGTSGASPHTATMNPDSLMTDSLAVDSTQLKDTVMVVEKTIVKNNSKPLKRR